MRIGHGAVAAAALLLLGCSNEGEYEVNWTIGQSAADEACALNGLDIVILDWVDGESGVCAGDVVRSTDHACRDGVATGLVQAGTYNLCAEALSPGGERFTGVVVAPDVPFSEDDLVIVTISLPVVPQCANGLDDDDDGRIDNQDPQCSDDLDVAE